MGKPIVEAEFDVADAAHCFEYYGGMASKIHGETLEVPDNALSMVVREPVGVVGQIIPWNYPLLMAAWKLAPALAAGCTAVLKPAEQTPLSALMLAEIFESLDLPPGVVNIVTGDGPTAGAGARHRSARRQDRVHRRRRHRHARHPRRGRDHQADVDRARRQEPEHRVRRRGLRGRGRRRALRRVRQPGRGLLGRLAAARRAFDLRPHAAGARRQDRRASRSAIR